MLATWKYRALILCLIFVSFPSLAQDNTYWGGDSLYVRFRTGQSDLDLSFSNNQNQLDQFVGRVRKQVAASGNPGMRLNLTIHSGSSPEGPEQVNQRLGERRGLALRKLIVDELGPMLDSVTIVNEGPRWAALYRMIESSREPWRDQVLSILSDHPGTDDWKVDPRESKLRKLKGGAVWNQLSEIYFPELRASGTAVVIPAARQEREWERGQARDTVVNTIIIRDTIIYLPELNVCKRPIDKSWVWGLKTNTLMWGFGAPNLQAEFPLGMSNRWSIEAEVFWPWWRWKENSLSRQIGNVGVEVKYWLGRREKHHLLDGWHLGLGFAGGYYDLELKEHHGYQGEYLNLYANIGFQHRFGRRKQWGVDAGIGFGWLPTQYRRYVGSSIFPDGYEEPQDYHLMWQESDMRNIFWATHANITISYFFHSKNQ